MTKIAVIHEVSYSYLMSWWGSPVANCALFSPGNHAHFGLIHSGNLSSALGFCSHLFDLQGVLKCPSSFLGN